MRPALAMRGSARLRGSQWYYLEELRKKYPAIHYVANRRLVVDKGVVTTTGISASMPTALTLIEAIAGRRQGAGRGPGSRPDELGHASRERCVQLHPPVRFDDEAMPCARAHVAAGSRMTKAVASAAATALAKNKSAEELLRTRREPLAAEKEFTRQRDPLFRCSPLEVDGGGVATTDDDADAFSGPRLVGPGGQCRERCCAARLRDDTQRAPEC